MIIIYGEKSYGKVDRVPGLCYVTTTFAHLNYIPLFPLRSYIVLEGTESGGEFRGKQIPTSLRSAAAGYARVWFGALAVVAGAIAGFTLYEQVAALGINLLAVVGLLAAGAGGLLALFVGGKVGAGIQVGVHLASAVLGAVFYTAAGPNARGAAAVEGPLLALLAANVGLLVHGLTRLMAHANPARSRELLQELGVEVPDEDDTGEPRESKWEGWDASPDRRGRGNRYE